MAPWTPTTRLATRPRRAGPARVHGIRGDFVKGFRQASRHYRWPTRARLGIGPPLTKGADADAMLGMQVGSCNRATGAHGPGLCRFRCRTCGKQFNERSGTLVNRTQYPSDVIALVVLWRLRDKLSLRDLPEMFAVRGRVFSHEAVREWEA